MRAIYAGAQAVVVATEAAVTKEARKVLNLLECIDPSLSARNQTTEVSDMIRDDSVQSALQSFCNDSYWGRIWIIQEYAIANNLQFLIQDRLVAADKLHHLLRVLDFEPRLEQWAQVRAIYNIRESFQKSQPFQLVQILEKTKSSSCRRRHDRVFALMGLLLDAFKYLLEPDYEADLTRTTLAMTRAYIQKECLDIILLASHCPPGSCLPTWCPDFYQFDNYPPDKRIVDLIANAVQPTTPNFYDTSPLRNATGASKPSLSYQGDKILTVASRIGMIRSLGKAWTDTAQSSFPAHDPAWTRQVSCSDLEKEMYEAIYSARPGLRGNMRAIHGHGFVQAFDSSHGFKDAGYVHQDFANWLCGNRKFFTGANTMEDYAKQQRHPFFSHGFAIWGDEYVLKERLCFDVVWTPFMDTAESNMRLMCLDNGPKHRIGWAAPTARLYDEVFLLPGCNVPVVLRRVGQGQFQLMGDAIVPGSMNNEIWGEVKPQNLLHIQIV